MKYICVNPEDIIKEVRKNGVYGTDRIGSRLMGMGKAEVESAVLSRILKPCQECVKGEVGEADIKQAFEYVDPQAYGRIGHDTIWAYLREIFEIEGFTEDDEVVFLRYLPVKAKEKYTEKENEISEEKWEKLDRLFQSLGPILYSDKDYSLIINTVLDRYIEDLLKRDDIVMEISPWGDGSITIGTENFYPEDIEYFVNGETIVVKSFLRGSHIAEVYPVNNRFPDDFGTVETTFYRVARNGINEEIGSVSKMLDDEYGFQYDCEIKGRHYRKKEKTTRFFPNTLEIRETIDGKENVIANPPEEVFDAYAAQLVDPKKLDKLKDAFWKKTKFVKKNKNSSSHKQAEWTGVVERGNWKKEMMGQTLPFGTTSEPLIDERTKFVVGSQEYLDYYYPKNTVGKQR